jgi:hypothetical protein
MVFPNPERTPKPRFPLGQLYATSAVIRWASRQGLTLGTFIRRHHTGDWGDLDPEDRQANEDALAHGGRIFSSYLTGDRKIYAITECDRSKTTILFAEEY